MKIGERDFRKAMEYLLEMTNHFASTAALRQRSRRGFVLTRGNPIPEAVELLRREGRAARPCGLVFLQNDVRADAPESERTHARAKRLAPAARPRLSRLRDSEWRILEADVAVQLAVVAVAGNRTVSKCKDGLHQSRDARRSFKVTDVGLYRPEQTTRRSGRLMTAFGVEFSESSRQAFDFYRIAKGRAGAVGLDVRDGRGVNIGRGGRLRLSAPPAILDWGLSGTGRFLRDSPRFRGSLHKSCRHRVRHGQGT